MSECWEPVIGLEIHVQLGTRTKMFCGCELTFGDPPNTHTCPVCLGLPGSLPVTNERAIHFGLLMALAFDCEIAPVAEFSRKNYFYPDNAKNYQISQYDKPLCQGGHLGDVRLTRIHLEEDAAKLVHSSASGRIHDAGASVVDYNRGGTPLAEMVTEPDIHSAEQAREWLTLLRETLRQLGVSDVDMSQGSLRCDANVSVRPAGATGLGTKTELKNMNSFAFLEAGIKAEIARQIALLEAGEPVVQETLHFDPRSGSLTTLRSKEEAHDYRYFPEPDLVPVAPTPEMLAAARAALPELPAARIERFVALGLAEESARVLVWRPERADFFEAAVREGAPPREAANWLGRAHEAGQLTPAALASLIALLENRTISGDAGRKVLEVLVAEGGEPAAIVEREGLGAIGGDELPAIVAKVLEENPDVVQRIRDGNPKAMGALMGPIMRETKGRADGGAVQALIREKLGL
ncbi:MAG: aspartyl-tRNA(Asn)/glutamyl-tRNA(Gln) amidotransferase subunit [Solirubrobacteraceae bacterium]|nr:aspartyl-tRNA(Asn)/glutamyl-tRNA(Gln) amidotransferase subunit [Solirubrobacteraceae bacterium]